MCKYPRDGTFVDSKTVGGLARIDSSEVASISQTVARMQSVSVSEIKLDCRKLNKIISTSRVGSPVYKHTVTVQRSLMTFALSLTEGGGALC